MRIIHYTLGLPPYRTGGLTKYSYDLIKNQVYLGQEVDLLYPGHFDFFKKTRIKKNNYKNNYKNNFGVYEIINPLPVSLLGGISEPSMFMKKTDGQVYYEFLNIIKPDIIHIHTLMGLHKEFIEAARKLNIKTIFTTHDYFGICLKVNFINYKGQFCKNQNQCSICNENSYDLKLIYLMQSRIYRNLKDNVIIKKLRKYKKRKIKKDNAINNVNQLKDRFEEYRLLKNYYKEIFNNIDYFHFNSSISMEEYNKFLKVKGKVIAISHNNISDNRKLKDFNHEKLKITYLGPLSRYKGYNLLIYSLKDLLKKDINQWHLNIWGNDNKPDYYDSCFYSYNGRYNSCDLEKIFKDTDLMIIPSIWKETFGYIGLEALSYGVPIILTSNVGFKDLIKDKKTGIVIKAEKEELTNKLRDIINNRNILKEINQNILKMDFKWSMEEHTNKIMEYYKKILK